MLVATAVRFQKWHLGSGVDILGVKELRFGVDIFERRKFQRFLLNKLLLTSKSTTYIKLNEAKASSYT